MKRKFLAIIFCVSFLFSLLNLPISADNKTADVVFVIDNSGSMRTNDPEKLALTGAEIFLDLFSATNSRAGYVMFTENIEEKYPLSQINGNTVILEGLQNTEYTSSGDTDIGKALETAGDMFGDTDNKKVIVLLTDGKPDVTGKTTEELYENIRQTNKKLEDKDILIYAIGLNVANSIETSQMTSLFKYYYEVSKNTDLTRRFIDVYISLINGKYTDGGNFESVGDVEEKTVNIPENIAQATISVTTNSGDLEEVSYVSPEGTEQKINLKSGRYADFRIENPKSGDWTVKIKSRSGSDVHISLLTRIRGLDTYTVTFVGNPLMSSTSTTIADGGTVAAPADPTYAGYNFRGWELDGMAFDFATPITADIVLTAKWESMYNPHTVTYYIGGELFKEETVDYGSKILKSTPKKTGFSFSGWFTDESLTQNYDFKTEVNNDVRLYGDFTKLKLSMALVIIWTIMLLFVSVFSVIFYPKVMEGRLFGANQLLASAPTVIVNLFFCLTIFFWFKNYCSLAIFDEANVHELFFNTPYIDIYRKYFYITGVVLPFIVNLIIAYLIPGLTDNSIEVKNKQFWILSFVPLIGVIFPAYLWYVVKFGFGTFFAFLVLYLLVYVANFYICSMCVRFSYARYFRYIA